MSSARIIFSLPRRSAVRVHSPAWRSARTSHFVVQKGPSLMRRAQNLRSFARHIVPQVRLQYGGVLGSSSPCHVALPYKFASQHGSRSSDLLGMEACVTCSIMSTNLRLTLSCDEQIGNGCRPSLRCFKTMQSPVMMPTIPHQLAPNTEPTSTCGCDIAQDSIFLCGWTSCPLVIKKQSSFHLPLRVTQKGKTRRKKGKSTRPSAAGKDNRLGSIHVSRIYSQRQTYGFLARQKKQLWAANGVPSKKTDPHLLLVQLNIG